MRGATRPPLTCRAATGGKPGKGKAADDSLNPCYYHNALLGLTQWQHPHLTYLMALAAELGGEKKGGGRPPAARDVFGE